MGRRDQTIWTLHYYWIRLVMSLVLHVYRFDAEEDLVVGVAHLVRVAAAVVALVAVWVQQSNGFLMVHVLFASHMASAQSIRGRCIPDKNYTNTAAYRHNASQTNIYHILHRALESILACCNYQFHSHIDIYLCLCDQNVDNTSRLYMYTFIEWNDEKFTTKS